MDWPLKNVPLTVSDSTASPSDAAKIAELEAQIKKLNDTSAFQVPNPTLEKALEDAAPYLKSERESELEAQLASVTAERDKWEKTARLYTEAAHASEAQVVEKDAEISALQRDVCEAGFTSDQKLAERMAKRLDADAKVREAAKLYVQYWDTVNTEEIEDSFHRGDCFDAIEKVEDALREALKSREGL